MLYDGLFRRCNCFVCVLVFPEDCVLLFPEDSVLVFPEDSVAWRVVEGERGTLGSRSQRHAG